jgi:hypothetical protein
LHFGTRGLQSVSLLPSIAMQGSGSKFASSRNLHNGKKGDQCLRRGPSQQINKGDQCLRRGPRKEDEEEDFSRHFAWQMRNERDGEAANPGPGGQPDDEMQKAFASCEEDWSFENEKGFVIVESINATSFATNLEQMRERRAHITAFQEHAMTDEQIHSVMLSLAMDGWNMLAGPRDPEHARRSGGVGIQCMKPLRPMKMQPISDDFKDAYKSGRAAAWWVDIGGVNVLFVVIYGWTGGLKGNEAAGRTDDLFGIIRNELFLQPKALTIMTGDINGDTDAYPNLQEMFDDEGWTDIGARVDMWGGVPNEPTCQVSAGTKANRRDFSLSTISCYRL